ncbi:aspartate/glutamate racemase family protein [Marinobacter sp.]|uniref:aspartate/glutamate racemase family protein n=1 Tax=Marinobacter sp. TaxID=50741 RepID=UPI00199DBF70|nr:aspartate/glutamate racemase family protein [Marinobacter sp.]MBC7193240.1 Asp/Glu/hydantoin racemase [Marinobacter sp.]
MNLLIINPNDSEAMRQQIETSCREVQGCRTLLDVVCAGAGVPSVEGFADGALAQVGVLERVREGEGRGYTGYLIACADDTGVHAARELARGPVVGIGEAAYHTAALLGHGFSVLTAQRKSIPVLEQNLRAYGLEHLTRGIEAMEMPVLSLPDASETGLTSSLLERARQVTRRHRSEVLVLGCAGLSPYQPMLQAELGLPVVDGVRNGLVMLEGLLRAGLATSKVNGYRADGPNRGSRFPMPS